jgi:hypothetical protein
MNVVTLKTSPSATPKKRKSGIPTGNAGEYFVMGELLRRGFDSQLADRNTAGYDLLVGRHSDPSLAKIQVKTVRTQPWYVKQSMFEGDGLSQITIYVLLGKETAKEAVRYFIVRNEDVANAVQTPTGWASNAFMNLKSILQFEGRWDLLG